MHRKIDKIRREWDRKRKRKKQSKNYDGTWKRGERRVWRKRASDQSAARANLLVNQSSRLVKAGPNWATPCHFHHLPFWYRPLPASCSDLPNIIPCKNNHPLHYPAKTTPKPKWYTHPRYWHCCRHHHRPRYLMTLMMTTWKISRSSSKGWWRWWEMRRGRWRVKL